MDSIQAFLMELAGKLPWLTIVLAALGSLVVIGQAVVLITPTKADDAILEKIESNSIGAMIINLLSKFAVIQKK